MKRALWLSVCILFFYSCLNKEKYSYQQLEYTFLKEKNAVNSKLVGVWKSIGNGYYLEAKNDSILLYSYTDHFCYKEKNTYLEGLLNAQSLFRLRQDTLAVYLTDFGAKTEILQTKKDFVRVDSLPRNCLGFSELVKLPSLELFELYRETMQENYAFDQRRNLHWQSLFDTYRDSLSSQEKSLFHSMGEIAIETKDQHTKVISESGETLQYRVTPSATVLKEVFGKQSEIKDLNEYFNLFFETNYKNISDSLLQGKGKKVVNGKLEWGHLNEGIGYINIHSFANLLGSEFTRKQQLDSLAIQMERIMGAFQDKDAIIVDISFNFGGYDATALTIAGYFTDTPVLAYKSQVYYENGFYHEDDVVLYPADAMRFTKPVYVLMTDISRSAAESFAMMMGSLPNVKLVGSNTLGTLSGMLGKSIGNYYTTYSNQRLVDKDGQFYEVFGVVPDIKRTVFKKEDIFQSHKTAIRDLMRIIDKSERSR